MGSRISGSIRWLVVAAFVSMAAPLQAQDIRDVTLRSLADAEVGYYSTGNVYVGPYGFQVGSDPGSPLWDFICVDFAHRVYKDDTYRAHFSYLSGDLSNTYKGELNTYLMAAYLARKFETAPAADFGEIHAAIWKITGGFPSGTVGTDYPGGGEASSSLVDDLIVEAEANYGTVNPDYWIVVSDATGSGDSRYPRQEFVTHVTPEPTSMLLLGTGMAGVAWFRRRRDGGEIEEDQSEVV